MKRSRWLRITAFATAILTLFCSICFAAEPVPFKLYSQSALVCDLTTGEDLYELNADELRYPASTTKIMTCIIALERLNFDEVVVVDQETAAIGGNTLNLKAGEKIVAKDLVYGTMVISANDGAAAIAKAVGGSIEEFARLMNEKAKEIGCTNTHFVNPHGLHDDDHYTTARDLKKIVMYCMKNETFRDIVSSASYTVPKTNKSEERTVYNTNWLLNDEIDGHKVYAGSVYRYCKYDGCIGIKTGQTNKAGACLIAAAERNGTTILSISMKSSDAFGRFADAIQLLDLGFATYKTVNSMNDGDYIGTINVKRGSVKTVDAVLSGDIFVTARTDDSNSVIKTEITLEDTLTAPVEAGMVVGSVRVTRAGEEVGVYDVLTKESVPKGGILSVFGIDDATAAKIFKVIKTVLIILVLIVVGFFVWVFFEKRRRAKIKARKAERKKQLEQQRNSFDDFDD